MKGQVVFRVRGVEAQSEMRVRVIYHFPEDLRVWWISLSSISKHSDLTRSNCKLEGGQASGYI